MTDLSPAALSVWCRFCEVVEEHGPPRLGLAAALRAAADQLVPVEAEIDPLKAWSIEDWNHMNATKYQREETRRQLLAIAAELEGAND